MSDKYGPNTAEIEALIEKVKTLTPEQAKHLREIWHSARDAVWDVTRDEGWSTTLYTQVDSTCYAAWGVAWYAACDAAWHAAWNATRDQGWSTTRDVACDEAWHAAWNAIFALSAKDRISDNDFRTLYGPWASVMEAKEIKDA